MNLGDDMERLKELRLEYNYRQVDVSKKIGVDRTTYVKYENGQSEPSFATLQKLAGIYDVSIDYLMGTSNIRNTKNAVREPTDDDIMFALFGGDQDVTEEDYEAVKAFASYIRDKRAKKTSGNNPDIKKD